MSGGRNIFITGAAAGIGNAMAQRFHRNGWRVGAYDVAPVDESAFTGQRGELVTGTLDVTDAEAFQAAVAEFCGENGRLNALINNAGILSSGVFEEIDIARQQAIINVNVNGTLNGCYAAHSYLARTPGSTVVNMCSASAIYGQPELAAYSASKFAIRGLTEALDLEWLDQGIRVIAMWPMFVNTGMVDGMNIGTTRSLGIRLTADDVADEIVETVEKPGLFPKVHHPVGFQAKLFANTAKFSPDWMSRMLNKRFASA